MKQILQHLLSTLELNPPATEEAIQAVEQQFGCTFPDDYRTFLLLTNGAEGSIGKKGYIVLWTLQRIVVANINLEVSTHASGLVLFGSDGGGEAYAFDTRFPTLPIVQVSYIGMSLDDNELISRAPTLTAFLQQEIVGDL